MDIATSNRMAVPTLLDRVAVLQPEMAPRIVSELESMGEEIVQDCMQSDAALSQHVNRVLVELFSSEVATEEDDEVQIFREGPGHLLPRHSHQEDWSSAPEPESNVSATEYSWTNNNRSTGRRVGPENDSHPIPSAKPHLFDERQSPGSYRGSESLKSTSSATTPVRYGGYSIPNDSDGRYTGGSQPSAVIGKAISSTKAANEHNRLVTSGSTDVQKYILTPPVTNLSSDASSSIHHPQRPASHAAHSSPAGSDQCIVCEIRA